MLVKYEDNKRNWTCLPFLNKCLYDRNWSSIYGLISNTTVDIKPKFTTNNFIHQSLINISIKTHQYTKDPPRWKNSSISSHLIETTQEASRPWFGLQIPTAVSPIRILHRDFGRQGNKGITIFKRIPQEAEVLLLQEGEVGSATKGRLMSGCSLVEVWGKRWGWNRNPVTFHL